MAAGRWAASPRCRLYTALPGAASSATVPRERRDRSQASSPGHAPEEATANPGVQPAALNAPRSDAFHPEPRLDVRIATRGERSPIPRVASLGCGAPNPGTILGWGGDGFGIKVWLESVPPPRSPRRRGAPLPADATD